MEITLEFLNKRMAEIMTQEDKVMAELNYLSGAKAECQYLINTLTERKEDNEAGTREVFTDKEFQES